VRTWLALYRRELALAWGRGGGPLTALAFFLGVTTLLPLAVGAEPGRLSAVAPGSAWLALALASLLSLERLFERDYEDGALDLLALGARRGGVLVAVIVLPLFAPPVIFGAGAIEALRDGLRWEPGLAFLAAYALGALALAPFAMAAAVRNALS